MKNFGGFVFLALLIYLLFSCKPLNGLPRIKVENSLDITRQFETVSLTKDFLKVDNLDNLGVRELNSQTILISQLVDSNSDGKVDQLLFQPLVAANSAKVFEIFKYDPEEKKTFEAFCYSRFVPERTDDYAWENNRVAFRTYGPTAQKMTEDGIAGGTLSSGIDAWLKKVEYPIINKWYKKELETEGTYHVDNGEGLDNFHVGVSRGVGGTAIKTDSTYHVSKNFANWKTIATGPIRTSFTLTYTDWNVDGKSIVEEKHISLDYGSNLSKFEVETKNIDTLSVGLTLHENDGMVISKVADGYISYWQPHKNSMLGTAIVTDGNTMIGYEKYITTKKDESNAYAHLKVKEGNVVYYAGFGWKESEQFKNQEEWEAYIASFAKKLRNPLKIQVLD